MEALRVDLDRTVVVEYLKPEKRLAEENHS
jgi:hypothetical protein